MISLALTVLLAQGIINPYQFGSGSPSDSDMIGEWLFSEGSLTSTADSAGSNDGTLVGGPTWTAENSGYSLDFDGTDDHVLLDSAITITDQFSVSFWCKVPSSLSTNNIMGAVDLGNAGILSVRANLNQSGAATAGYMHCTIRNDSNGARVRAFFNDAVDDGDWHHVVIVRDGNEITAMYFDGTAQTLFGGTDTLTTGDIVLDFPMVFGATNARGTIAGFFDGTIDTIQFYTKALSSSEVTDLYNAQTP